MSVAGPLDRRLSGDDDEHGEAAAARVLRGVASVGRRLPSESSGPRSWAHTFRQSTPGTGVTDGLGVGVGDGVGRGAADASGAGRRRRRRARRGALGLSARQGGSSWSSRLDLIRWAFARSLAVMPEMT